VEHYALASEVYGIGLVFARVGALLMLIPGVGEAGVPPRIRISLALLLSFVIYPTIRQSLPAPPATLDVLVGQLLIELLIGLALGSIIKLFMGTLAVTGETVALQTTLAFSQTANPLEAQPGSTVTSFLSIVGVALVFTTNLHQMFIGAIVHSFSVFTPGRPPPVGDVVSLAVKTTGETFALGVQLAAPVLVFSLVINIAVGLIGRILPSFQIFFAATPMILLFGLAVFALGLGMAGLVWVDHYRAFTARLI
jgi:flagellar biosynthetic protein FliR